ncbi:MAG: pyrroline-5-carboxylate reductase [Candidatus Faecousia sp.]|nr:pyrroline-5-carboxylate reductase [Candidatus Faecousia sp.]
MVYGFIGLGNMASAILRGMAKSGSYAADTLCGYNPTVSKTLALQKELGLVPCESVEETARRVDIIVLAVKPQKMDEVLAQICPAMNREKLVVTVAAGKPLSYYEQRLPQGVSVVRVMPNINAKVCASVSALCGGTCATEAHLALVRRLFETVGTVFEIDEAHFSAFSALGGASGAFVLLYLDALASSGVKAGFPRQLAMQIACQTVLGSAKLAMDTGAHPIALMDEICSPGGTTIEGVHTLKRLGFETAVEQGIDAIIAKDQKLSK